MGPEDPHEQRDQYAKRRNNFRRLNNALHMMTFNKYHDSVPLDTVNQLLTIYGFDELEPMILCGREGRLHEAVGSNRWLSLTWYKMESNRYEVVAYVS